VSFESQDAGTLYGVGFLYRKSGPPHIGGPLFSPDAGIPALLKAVAAAGRRYQEYLTLKES